METEKKMMNENFSLTYEGNAEFGIGAVYIKVDGQQKRIADVVNEAVCDDEKKFVTMRCRIQLTIDRLPDDDLKVEVK